LIQRRPRRCRPGNAPSTGRPRRERPMLGRIGTEVDPLLGRSAGAHRSDTTCSETKHLRAMKGLKALETGAEKPVAAGVWRLEMNGMTASLARAVGPALSYKRRPTSGSFSPEMTHFSMVRDGS